MRDRRNYFHEDPREVDAEAGREMLVEIALPPPGTELAVSGWVLDEEARAVAGLYLAFQMDGDGDRRFGQRTDAAGCFELWAAPARTLTVEPSLPDRDLFEPERATVPFGATGVEFRRVRRIALRERSGVVLDARTGRPIAVAGPGGELRLPQPLSERLEVSAPGYDALLWSTAHRSSWRRLTVALSKSGGHEAPR